MFDWGMIISGLLGIVGGGGLTALFLRKQTKAGAEADAIDKAADAMRKLLENAEQQQTTFNSIIEGKDKLIEQQQGLIDGYKAALLDANQKLKTMEYAISDNKRKIDGLQRAVNNEISERKAAEENICFVYDCELRRPKRGTYKKETA
jgi:chromosome segregation ATPase